jgi:hypothetical protein
MEEGHVKLDVFSALILIIREVNQKRKLSLMMIGCGWQYVGVFKLYSNINVKGKILCIVLVECCESITDNALDEK